MANKYINFNLNDSRAEAIAEVMTNKTAKKILSLLAEKEMSGGDLSVALKLPLNTIGYNIDKLLRAELIEKSKNYFWSAKGKKIATYNISNKKIIISPKSVFSGILPAMLISIACAFAVKLYYSTSAAKSLVKDAAVETISQANTATTYAPIQKIQEISTTTEYSWLWFLLGALIALLAVLILNWRKTK